MTLIRKAATDFDWPAWMAGRSVLDFPESWIDSIGEAAIKVEEYEDGDELIIRAEAPGVNPEDDIEITITEGMSSWILVNSRAAATLSSQRQLNSFRTLQRL